MSRATNILKDADCTEVYLFGSQATGKAHFGSDVALGVKGLSPSLLFRMHSDLEEALRMPVDLVDFDSQVDFYNLLQRVGELRKIGQLYKRNLQNLYKEYLGFRHVFQHSYGYELDWERLNPLFSGMSDVCQKVKADLEKFLLVNSATLVKPST